jgi:hypothetical protein
LGGFDGEEVLSGLEAIQRQIELVVGAARRRWRMRS